MYHGFLTHIFGPPTASSYPDNLCQRWHGAACNANDPCTVGLRHLRSDAAYSPRGSAHNDHVTFGWRTQDPAHPNEGGDTRGDAKEVQRGFLRNLGAETCSFMHVRLAPKSQNWRSLLGTHQPWVGSLGRPVFHRVSKTIEVQYNINKWFDWNPVKLWYIRIWGLLL